MDQITFLMTIVAGFVGTIAMTLLMYAYTHLSKKNTRVIHILGTMVTGGIDNTNNLNANVLVTGSIAHVSVGILFCFAYFLLWNWGVFDITVIDSIIVGTFSGVLAVIVWKLYFMVHQQPPQVPLLHYFAALFISHIIFGLVTVFVFGIIIENPQFWYQLQEEISVLKIPAIMHKRSYFLT